MTVQLESGCDTWIRTEVLDCWSIRLLTRSNALDDRPRASLVRDVRHDGIEDDDGQAHALHSRQQSRSADLRSDRSGWKTSDERGQAARVGCGNWFCCGHGAAGRHSGIV